MKILFILISSIFIGLFIAYNIVTLPKNHWINSITGWIVMMVLFFLVRIISIMFLKVFFNSYWSKYFEDDSDSTIKLAFNEVIIIITFLIIWPFL